MSKTMCFEPGLQAVHILGLSQLGFKLAPKARHQPQCPLFVRFALYYVLYELVLGSLLSIGSGAPTAVLFTLLGFIEQLSVVVARDTESWTCTCT